MLGWNGMICDVYATSAPLENLPFLGIKTNSRRFQVEAGVSWMKLDELSLFFQCFLEK
jgi:hypothetical protein